MYNQGITKYQLQLQKNTATIQETERREKKEPGNTNWNRKEDNKKNKIKSAKKGKKGTGGRENYSSKLRRLAQRHGWHGEKIARTETRYHIRDEKDPPQRPPTKTPHEDPKRETREKL